MTIKLNALRLASAAAFAVALSATASFADTRLSVVVTTGGDDLRSGNSAYLRLVLQDGTRTPEQVLSRGLAGGSVVTVPVRFTQTVAPGELRGFEIRHDGRPRPGHPFDTYDNWDLRSLHVTRLFPTGGTEVIYDSRNDSRVGALIRRFTAAARVISFPTHPLPGEPDFTIANLSWWFDGVRVTVDNIGPGLGTVTGLSCSVSGRHMSVTTSVLMAPGARAVITVRLPAVPRGATATCSVDGVNRAGGPEQVTRNNVRRQIVR